MSIVMAVSPAAKTLNGEGWRQAAELGVALLLSAAIGLERDIRQKDAGLPRRDRHLAHGAQRDDPARVHDR